MKGTNYISHFKYLWFYNYDSWLTYMGIKQSDDKNLELALISYQISTMSH